ncbi:IS630 family transposase [Capsulimonas corticalis]|uniref:IS630 family transposase n=1 Tax=Capsulimonas corticalis TaxID=2219043 RepID=UPI001FEBB9DE|nr:IS630 family transposase [Capsulimonas corticalis]
MDYTYRRTRRRPPKTPPVEVQERTQRALLRMHRLEEQGRCQVFYGDESGFCLQPPVPYMWQKKGETVCIPSHGHSKRLNAVSFLSKDNQIHTFLGYEAITAHHMIESFDKIASQITVPTVIVLDNASIHRAKIVREKRAQWKKQGLRLFFLPPYCPHLNKVETLWRMVKYRWLAPRDYASFETLCKSVENILRKIGQEYRISFA